MLNFLYYMYIGRFHCNHWATPEKQPYIINLLQQALHFETQTSTVLAIAKLRYVHQIARRSYPTERVYIAYHVTSELLSFTIASTLLLEYLV